MASVERQRTIAPDADALRRRSLHLLEFDRVREALAVHASMPSSKDLALALEPAYDPGAVRERQEETAEALLVMADSGPPSVATERDIRPIIERVGMQVVLTGEELDALASALELTRRAKSVGTRLTGRTPHLRALSRSVPDLRPLEREIRSKVMPSGEIDDGATPFLRELRRDARAAYKRATDALDAVIGGDGSEEFLQERLVTLRADRLVLPVKAEFRARMPGVVHGVSDSGATLFVEPFTSVGATNAWRERMAQEREEVERILRQLSMAAWKRTADIAYALEITARIDLSFTRARYAQALGAGPVGVAARGVDLVEARHPLIGQGAVPVSMRIVAPSTGLVVTGPNTGGKTVALKTLGLAVLMHQSGLMVPCEETTQLPIVDGVYADIGDQQSIDAAVSTFSSHMSNIASIVRVATERSLVLLDELGTSTDPDEGSALAMALLAHLAEREVPTVVTTHHRGVAAFAEEHETLENASVELDPDTLAPTYRVTMGLPGRSYALAVAERLGLEQSIIEMARGLQDPAQRSAEALLASIQEERLTTRRRLEEAEQAGREAAAMRLELERRLEELALAQEQVVEETRREVQGHVREVLARLKRAEAVASWEASREPPPPREVAEARTDVAEVQRMLRSRIWGKPKSAPARRAPIATGDTVVIGPLGFTGKVVAGPDDAKRVEVLVGSATIRMDAGRLRRVDAPTDEDSVRTTVQFTRERPALAAEAELDIRGLRVHEALERIDAFLDDALADGRNQARVIHGKGTGALRQGVWRHLASHRGVETFDYEDGAHGGDGATLVELA